MSADVGGGWVHGVRSASFGFSSSPVRSLPTNWKVPLRPQRCFGDPQGIHTQGWEVPDPPVGESRSSRTLSKSPPTFYTGRSPDGCGPRTKPRKNFSVTILGSGCSVEHVSRHEIRESLILSWDRKTQSHLNSTQYVSVSKPPL